MSYLISMSFWTFWSFVRTYTYKRQKGTKGRDVQNNIETKCDIFSPIFCEANVKNGKSVKRIVGVQKIQFSSKALVNF